MKMPINRAINKKKALLAYKEKLLNDIKYYERRIDEDQSSNASTADFVDSSDSDDDCPFTIDAGPSEHQLKSQQKMLQTGLHATQELASLMVVNSKVNVMVEDPEIIGEAPVTEPGLWKVVNAECKIDLVPFTIKFYAHQGNGTFGVKSYRGVKVLPAKPAQEVELMKSVLKRVATPSDAVEVIRNYAASYRSRRATLARLADKYATNLFMEPRPEGGYLLKCANILEISWVLENKWSPVAPFYHKMVFDVENMDECYIKIIRHAHKQLGDPSIDTDQRTLLLAKIITTCLEAQGTQELYESMESDTESVNRIEKRRLTLEHDESESKKTNNDTKNSGTEHGNTNKNSDDQIMAPPKSLPKKGRPKGKENTDQNRKSVKRAAENESNSGKKAKTDTVDSNKTKQNDIENNKVVGKDTANKTKKDAANKEKTPMNDDLGKRSEKEKSKEPNIQNEKATKTSKSNEIKNTNKERIIDQQKAKVTKTKSKNQGIDTEKGESQDKENSEKQAEKVKIQQKCQQKKSQKVNNETHSAANSKENVKNLETQDRQSKKEIEKASSKNEAKAKISVNQKTSTQEKNITSSKNDLKSKESDTESCNKDVNNIDNVIDQNRAKTIAPNHKTIDIDEIPIMAANNIIEIPKKGKNIENAIKTKKIAPKTVKSNELAVGKIKKNNDKPDDVIKTNKKSADNAKKSIVDKEVKSNEEVTKKVSNDKQKSNSNNVEKTQKSNSNNVEKTQKSNSNNVEKTQKSGNNDEKDFENNKTQKDAQKINTQKENPAKNYHKNTNDIHTKNAQNREKSSVNREKMDDIKKSKATENENRQSKITVEKSKHTNVATKNGENTNIGDGKKMPIKTLTHKSYSASKKIAKNLNSSSRINLKSGNVAKISKSANIGKISKTGNINRISKTSTENNSASKISKIPKRLSIHESFKKKNPLRISPRKLPSSFNSSSESNLKQRSYFTNIPRLLKKPDSKKISK